MTDPNRCPACGRDRPADAPGGLCDACLLRAGLASSVTASATPRFSAPALTELQPFFPELEILGLIGQGGMGAVYKARQLRLDRTIALKVLSPGLGQDPAFAERFAREARALARLNHPNLVAIYDYGQAGPWFWIAMEHVDGANLRHVLATGAMSQSQALTLVRQLCDALQYAHDEGVVHRDIKPENILLDARGRAKIADFGLAKLADPSPGQRALTATHELMGTAHYMAPEQIEGAKSVDHRADIYSLGVVLYELLTGGLPLGRFEAPSHAGSLVDARVDDVVLKALAKDPERRYQRADEVSRDVERIASAGPRATASATGIEGADVVDGILLLVASVLLLAGAIFTALLLRSDRAAGDVDTDVGAAITAGLLAPLLAWSGTRMLAGGHPQWQSAAKILTGVAIVPGFACSPWLGTGLLLLALHLFRVPWMQHQLSRVRERFGLEATKTPPSTPAPRAAPVPPATPVPPASPVPPATPAPPATSAASAPSPVPAPAPRRHHASRIVGLCLAALVVTLVCGLSRVVVDSSGTTLRLGGEMDATSIRFGVWLAVVAGLASVSTALLCRQEARPYEGAAAPTALHALVTGLFRLLNVLVLSAVLIAVELVALVAWRPELLPISVRRSIDTVVRIPIDDVPQREAEDIASAISALDIACDRNAADVDAHTDMRQAGFYLTMADDAKQLVQLAHEEHPAGEALPTRNRVMALLNAIDDDLAKSGSPAIWDNQDSRTIRSSLSKLRRAPELIGAIPEATLRVLEQQLTSPSRWTAWKDAVGRYCFSSAQAERLLAHFDGDAADRALAITLIRPRLTDPENFVDH